RMTRTELPHQLISQKAYREEELPTTETIGTKLNQLGYSPKKVAKSHPKKTPRVRPGSNSPRKRCRLSKPSGPRLPHLDKWFVDIVSPSPDIRHQTSSGDPDLRSRRC